MCGIAGMLGEVDQALLERMTGRLAHRGPDGRGCAVIGQAGLGNTRLSLLDLEHGAQPMVDEEEGLALAYNGEIYNCADLRRRLEEAGQSFRGRCDTEVLLRAYQTWGQDCLPRLEGMYAFAVSDGRSLFLARDPFGIKPLLVALSQDGRRLLFASEIKALLEDASWPRTVNRSTLCQLFVFGYPSGLDTYFKAVRYLPPGGALKAVLQEDGSISLSQGVHSPPQPVHPPGGEEELLEAFIEGLRTSVREQMAADHPVGVYLSGGLDSSLLTALMVEEAQEEVHSFTSADSSDNPDLEFSRTVASRLGTRHWECRPSAADVGQKLPLNTLAFEGPASLSLVASIAPQMRPHVKAALCGEGADELFGGYVMHAQPELWLKSVSDKYRLLKMRGADSSDREGVRCQLESLRSDDGAKLQSRVDDFFLGPQLARGHLHPWDMGSMAFSLEVRVPYLCGALRNLAAALPRDWKIRNGERKYLVRQAARKLLPADIAEQITGRGKLSGPRAARRAYGTLKHLGQKLLASDWCARHPVSFLGAFPSLLLRFDLFVFLFICRQGQLPADFGLSDLYTVHREELERGLRQAVPDHEEAPQT